MNQTLSLFQTDKGNQSELPMRTVAQFRDRKTSNNKLFR